MNDDISERTPDLQHEDASDTLDSISPRLTWVIVVIGRVIVAAASVLILYKGVEQAYWALMVALNLESALSMTGMDPTMLTFVWVLSAPAFVAALAGGRLGLLVAFTARITDVGAVVGGDRA